MITIPFDPNIFNTGGFTLSWHGLFSFIGVASAVFFVARWAKRDGINPDIVYNVAVFAIIGGIIGARIVHVADNWGFYSNNAGDIFAVWAGGIGLWGGILGGWIGGLIYAYITKAPIGKLMDLTAPAMLVAQSIGRVGDIINGEHWSRATDLPWGWVFTHPESPGLDGAIRFLGDASQAAHPVVVYEMITNAIILAILWKLRGKIRPAGSLWMIYLSLYSVARFGLQWLRLDDVKFLGLQEAHIIALIVLAVTIPWLFRYARWRRDETEPEESSGGGRGRRSGRRRRATV